MEAGAPGIARALTPGTVIADPDDQSGVRCAILGCAAWFSWNIECRRCAAACCRRCARIAWARGNRAVVLLVRQSRGQRQSVPETGAAKAVLQCAIEQRAPGLGEIHACSRTPSSAPEAAGRI